MTSPHEKDEALRRREQELRDRELAIRLRELEVEVNSPPSPGRLQPQEKERRLHRGLKTLVRVGQFLAIVVALIILVRIATWLASMVLVAAIAWIVFKLVWGGDRSSPRR